MVLLVHDEAHIQRILGEGGVEVPDPRMQEQAEAQEQEQEPMPEQESEQDDASTTDDEPVNESKPVARKSGVRKRVSKASSGEYL